MIENELHTLSVELGEVLAASGKMLVTAESCTGGLVAKSVTDVAGSSGWFDRAFVTYTNAAKNEMLGVSMAMIDKHGAVSEPVVRQMVSGALSASRAQIAVAISGVAGPGGGSEDKPVGTVWFAWAYGARDYEAERMLFDGDREQVREQAAAHAIRRIINRLSS